MQDSERFSGSHFKSTWRGTPQEPQGDAAVTAFHVSYYRPEYRKALVEQLSRNLGLEMSDMEVGDLFELLFEEPLRNVRDPCVASLIVIVDTKDETSCWKWSKSTLTSFHSWKHDQQWTFGNPKMKKTYWIFAFS